MSSGDDYIERALGEIRKGREKERSLPVKANELDAFSQSFLEHRATDAQVVLAQAVVLVSKVCMQRSCTGKDLPQEAICMPPP